MSGGGVNVTEPPAPPGAGGAVGHTAPGVCPCVTAYTMPAVDSVNHSGW